MDAIEDGNCLRVNIHVFARGDGRERVHARVEEVGGRLARDKLVRSIGAHAADRELGVPAGVDAHRRGE